MRRGSLIEVFSPNIICENGHAAYSSIPETWITTATTLRFCVHPKCAGKSVRVRATNGPFQYEHPAVIVPHEGVEEDPWL